MAVRHFRHLITWQLADEFESEVLRIVRGSPAAFNDLRYRSQVEDAAGGVPSNVAEGFARRSAGDFCRFLNYAQASLVETEIRLEAGLKRGLFDRPRCQAAFTLARRTLVAIVRLRQSQERFINERREEHRRTREAARHRRPPKPPKS